MELSKTITSIFMVPTLNIGRDRLQENDFLNAYSLDLSKDIGFDKRLIYLLFKPNNKDLFKLFLDEEYEKGNIIEDYDLEDGFVVMVYQLNEKYDNDFDLIRRGKYSKTSPDFQELFRKVIKIKKEGKFRDEISLQHKIFRKSEDLKEYWEDLIGKSLKEDMEVWPTWDLEKETLNINKIKELV